METLVLPKKSLLRLMIWLLRNVLILILAVTVLFSACQRQKPVSTKIPKSSLMIAEADMRRLLLNAISLNNLLEGDFFISGTDSSAAAQGPAPKGIDQSGVDLFGKLTFFVLPGEGPDSYLLCAAMPLKDPKKFATYVESLGGVAKDMGNYKLASLPGRESYIGWNSEMAFITSDYQFSEGIYASEETIRQIFQTEESGSIQMMPEYLTFHEESADIRILITQDGMHQLNGFIRQYLPFHFPPESHLVSKLDFKSGHIQLKNKLFIGEEFEELAASLFHDAVSMEMVKNTADDRSIASISANLDPASVGQLLKTTGQEVAINQFLWLAGMNTDSLLLYADGEFSFGLVKTEMVSEKRYNHGAGKEEYVTDTVSYYKVGMGLAAPEYIKNRIKEFYEKGILIPKENRYSFANLVGLEHKGNQLFVFGPDSHPESGEIFNSLTSDPPAISHSSVWCRVNAGPAHEYMRLMGYRHLPLKNENLKYLELRLLKVEKDKPIEIEMDLHFNDKETNALLQVMKLFGAVSLPV